MYYIFLWYIYIYFFNIFHSFLFYSSVLSLSFNIITFPPPSSCHSIFYIFFYYFPVNSLYNHVFCLVSGLSLFINFNFFFVLLHNIYIYFFSFSVYISLFSLTFQLPQPVSFSSLHAFFFSWCSPNLCFHCVITFLSSSLSFLFTGSFLSVLSVATLRCHTSLVFFILFFLFFLVIIHTYIHIPWWTQSICAAATKVCFGVWLPRWLTTNMSAQPPLPHWWRHVQNLFVVQYYELHKKITLIIIIIRKRRRGRTIRRKEKGKYYKDDNNDKKKIHV